MKLHVYLAMLLFAFSSVYAVEGGSKEVRVKSKSNRGWLGVSIKDVTPQFARDNNLKIKEGAYVEEVVEKSPADSAGFKKGDVIVEFNGKKIETSEDLSSTVQTVKPGTKVTVKVNRNGDSKAIGVTVGKQKMNRLMSMGVPRAPRMIVKMFSGDVEGMDLMDLNPQLAEYFEAPEGSGVLVKSVEKNENAEKAGVKAGDIITKFGSESVSDVDDVYEALEDADEGSSVALEVIRKGKKMSLSLEVSKREFGDNQEFWHHSFPDKFKFHFEPEMDRLHKEMEIRMKERSGEKMKLKKIEANIRKSET